MLFREGFIIKSDKSKKLFLFYKIPVWWIAQRALLWNSNSLFPNIHCTTFLCNVSILKERWKCWEKVKDEMLCYIAPLEWKYILLSNTYVHLLCNKVQITYLLFCSSTDLLPQILFFLWLKAPCKISEHYDNSFREKSNPAET